MNIFITIENQTFEAELNESPGARKLSHALPLTVRLSRWGDEYYGNCGLSVAEDSTARELLHVGEIAFWPPGQALCLFFGPTPASTDDRPRAASPVVPLGKITGDATALRSFGSSVEAQLRRDSP